MIKVTKVIEDFILSKPNLFFLWNKKSMQMCPLMCYVKELENRWMLILTRWVNLSILGKYLFSSTQQKKFWRIIYDVKFDYCLMPPYNFYFIFCLFTRVHQKMNKINLWFFLKKKYRHHCMFCLFHSFRCMTNTSLNFTHKKKKKKHAMCYWWALNMHDTFVAVLNLMIYLFRWTMN